METSFNANFFTLLLCNPQFHRVHRRMVLNFLRNNHYLFQGYDIYLDQLCIVHTVLIGNAGQLLLRPVMDLNCVLSFVLRKYEGKKFKWRLQTKVICDVNKNRKNNMFTSCANNVAYRGLAESFHWSDHLSDRLCVNHKCWQYHIHCSRSKLWEKDSMNGLR